MCVMAIFHYTEFLSIAIIQPNLVSTDSFVINHSKEYTIAALTSWTEYFLEYYFFSSKPDFFIRINPNQIITLILGMKTIHWLSNIGLIICVGGELLRKSAMFTAKSNFNHIVLKRSNYNFCP